MLGYLHLSRSIIVAKTTSGFNSDHITRQYAHGLLLESQFLPPSTDCLAVRAKKGETGSRNMAATQKINFLTRQFFARTYRFATIQNVTDNRRQTDRRHIVPKARPIVRSAKNKRRLCQCVTFCTSLNRCLLLRSYLQCFDAVGWASGRASGL